MPRRSRFLWILGLALPGLPAAAQPPPDSVPYVPTPLPVVSAMLALGEVGPRDVVYDLGSGDGRIPILAARDLGARGVGVEIDPRLVRRSRSNARAAGVAALTRFEERDLFAVDLRGASVVTLFLSTPVNLQLRPKLLRELAPGARVVSHTFHMGDWAPDSVVHLGSGFGRTTLYRWTVPADVDGFWQLFVQTPRGEQAFVLEIRQRFQILGGAARAGERELSVEGRMNGERIWFLLRDPAARAPAGAYRFTGRRAGAELEGSYTPPGSSTTLRWRAARFGAAQGPTLRRRVRVRPPGGTGRPPDT